MPFDTWQAVFPYGDRLTARNAKRTWVGDDGDDEYEDQLVAIDNEPLTSLLFELRTLVRRNILERRSWHLTYDVVLLLFGAALAKQGWPVDDWQEYTIPETPEVSSLVAPQYDIPASEAPHAQGRFASAGVLIIQRELPPSQPAGPLAMNRRHPITGVTSYTETNKRALEEDEQNNEPMTESVDEDALPRAKRPRVESASLDVLYREVNVGDNTVQMNN